MSTVSPLDFTFKEFEKFYSTKKILITGGRGFLGSCVSSELSSTGALIYLVDNSSSTWVPRAADNVRVVNSDVTNIDTVAELLGEVDCIFHLAALEYQRDRYDLLEDYLNNAKPLADIMEACVKRSARPTIVFSSSANIFGLQRSVPISESSRDNPPSLWSAHKLLAEKYISIYSTRYNFKSIVLRLPNIFGPTVRPETFCRSSINKMILDALSTGDIELFANSQCLRDQIFSSDAAKAFLLAGMFPRMASEDTMFVVGSGAPHTYLSLAEVISRQITNLTGKPVKLNFRNDRFNEPLDQRDFVANSNAFSALTGWAPGKNLEERICETIQFAITQGIK